VFPSPSVAVYLREDKHSSIFIPLMWVEELLLDTKAVPQCTIEARGERRYSSYSFMILALDRGEWSASRPGRTLPPGK
jgi:hypothetical protein